MSSTRKGLLIAVKLVLASALLAWIGLSGRFPWSSFARLAEPSALRLLAVAGACVVLSQLVAAWRWRLLLAPSRLELSLGSLFAVNYVGLLFNNFILGGQGGDLVRIGLLGRAFPEQKADATAPLVLDRLIGVAGLCAAEALCTALAWPDPLARGPLERARRDWGRGSVLRRPIGSGSRTVAIRLPLRGVIRDDSAAFSPDHRRMVTRREGREVT